MTLYVICGRIEYDGMFFSFSFLFFPQIEIGLTDPSSLETFGRKEFLSVTLSLSPVPIR